MEYKVGQKVRIKDKNWFDSIEPNRYYDKFGCYYNSTMRQMAGEIVTIREIYPSDWDGTGNFRFEENVWNWTIESFTPCGKYVYKPNGIRIKVWNKYQNMLAKGFEPSADIASMFYDFVILGYELPSSNSFSIHDERNFVAMLKHYVSDTDNAYLLNCFDGEWRVWASYFITL